MCFRTIEAPPGEIGTGNVQQEKVRKMVCTLIFRHCRYHINKCSVSRYQLYSTFFQVEQSAMAVPWKSKMPTSQQMLSAFRFLRWCVAISSLQCSWLGHILCSHILLFLDKACGECYQNVGFLSQFLSSSGWRLKKVPHGPWFRRIGPKEG